MSKGWGRRPASVDRKAYDEAYERTFRVEPTSSDALTVAESGAVEPRNEVAAPRGHRVPDGCEIAETMTQGFHDQRSRA